MNADDLSTPARLAIAVAIVVIGLLAGRLIARRTGWAPAAGIALLVATPLVPHVPVIGGLSLDDILPLLGVAYLATAVDLSRLGRVRIPWLLVVGVALAVTAGIISSIANGTSPAQTVTMLLRSPGRYAFLAVIVTLVALAEPATQRGLLTARAMALLGTAEAAFGLAAFFLPLGGIGLEPTRKFSVLYFEVPGRIAGTLGISPNFLGAIFVLTIVLTAGLAIDAREGRQKALLWASILLQTLALTLTFTRASLGLAIVALAVLLLLRGRIRYMVPVLAVVGVGFLTTPSAASEPGSNPTTPAPPVAVVRLTSDVPDRLALWYSATLMMVDHPFTGVGPGRTLQLARSVDRYGDTPFGAAENSAHNSVLLAGAETGVLGALGALLINLGFALASLRILFRARRAGIAAIEVAGAVAVLGYLAQGMVNNLFSVAAAGAVFAVVAGAYVVRLETTSAEPSVTDGADQSQRAPTGPPVELSL